ncbi:transglycosylase SLT domain-containing protein [Neorhizobium sp. NPDC001467]|uniref:lytic transglycosylase domain-containing protein n=1 Tax=Neorhizobium sp. NPDC001467 TaxID=3390595 RepID=UPI003D0544CD
MRHHVLILAGLGLGLTAGAFDPRTGTAAPLPEGPVPLPFVRPDAPVSAAALPSPDITGSIPSVPLPLRGDRPGVVGALKTGLDALSGRDAGMAIATRNTLAAGSLDRQILTWAIATSGLPGVPSSEIAAAQSQLHGWPGLNRLRGHSERALYRENPAPAQVLAAFGNSAAETPEGAIILARALVATGSSGRAASTLRTIWTGDALDKGTEDRILKEFSGLLSASDHKARMDYLMYRGRAAQAAHFADLGQAQALYKAWAAVASGAKNADALLDAASARWSRDPAYLFARIEALRHQDRYREAAALLDKAPRDATRLVNGGEWWNERRIIARGLADRGDYAEAYRVVSHHTATAATDIVDAEFHAGFYALRELNNPQAAEKHFRAILTASSRPLSASRALYWLGRAAEAGGPGRASDFYRQAAQYAGTFYGQLAAAKLGTKVLNVAYPAPSEADRRNFENREVVRAIDRLDAAGHDSRANALYRSLAEEITSPGELAILTARAERNGDHALSLQIGKSAFARGIEVAALAYPTGVIPSSADIAGSGKALAYAIARQESAFNPSAVSPADARGLLQILPGTAKGVAGRHGIPYTAARLTTDAGYNATLGAHYLGEQIDSFGGSYILTFIAYNAGPRRVPEWIARYGDPRGKSLDDVIDWIERIPFPETRNYVQRVMENYQVYKTRLGQTADIEDDLRFGRR